MKPLRYVARQPIFDREEKVFGYELLFRDGLETAFTGDRDEASRATLDRSLLMGLDVLCDGRRAFVNCTRDTLIKGLVTLLPSTLTVVEILESVPADELVVAACRRLKEAGYMIALDDFAVNDPRESLTDFADIIKVDLRDTSAADAAAMVKRYGPWRCRMLAEKVETREEFIASSKAGFRYFQGYFFSRPTVLSREEVPLNHLSSLGLLAALARSPLDHREIERLVLADAPICFRLMRLVNSPIYGMRDQIDSVRRALVVVGETEFRKLATVAIAGSLGHRQPHALISLSLQRARFCELLAPHLNQDPVEQYLMGLLSLLDAILQTPMAEIVDLLPLRPSVRTALLGEYNATAIPLCIARSFETGDWASSMASSDLISLGPELLNNICIDATRWADSALPASAAGK